MAYSILCVDDEQLILLFLKRALEHTGYTIYTADDGVDALDKIKEHRPDLVFLDVAMPEMSGDEALPLIHEIDPTIAVIIISGKVSKNCRRCVGMRTIKSCTVRRGAAPAMKTQRSCSMSHRVGKRPRFPWQGDQ